MSDNRQSRLYHSIPFLINVRELSEQQIDEMVDALIHDFGGSVRFGKDMFMDVLQDHLIEAADPMKFKRGPFVGLRFDKNGDPAVTAASDPKDVEEDRGVTIYGHDQFLEFAKQPEVFMMEVLETQARKLEAKNEKEERRKHTQDSGFGMG